MRPINVLLVSDDASLRAFVQGTLIVEGYRVDTVYKGINGLTLALLKSINLFLIDDALPDMSSIDLLQEIKSRAELQDIPVIAIADNTVQKDCWMSIGAGAQGCLFKPFTGAELITLVREHVHSTSTLAHH